MNGFAPSKSSLFFVKSDLLVRIPSATHRKANGIHMLNGQSLAECQETASQAFQGIPGYTGQINIDKTALSSLFPILNRAN